MQRREFKWNDFSAIIATLRLPAGDPTENKGDARYSRDKLCGN
jgi:hypothetical protein